MKYSGPIQPSMESPTWDEPFWELEIHWTYEMDKEVENPTTEEYSLNRTWHFNSQTDTNYQTMFAQVGSPLYVWMPESQILNSDSELFVQHKQFLIDNKIRFVKLIDGKFWVVDDDVISEAVA